MLCQKCHKNLATMRYAEVVDGQVVEQQLCPECLNILQGAEAVGFNFTGPPAVVRKPSASSVVREAVESQRTCPTCGIAWSQVLESGRTGCPTCYETFGSQVESELERIQPSLLHKGKVNRLDDSRARLRAELQTKRGLLRQMLKAENYEEAASLRDAIRTLESGLSLAESGTE